MPKKKHNRTKFFVGNGHQGNTVALPKLKILHDNSEQTSRVLSLMQISGAIQPGTVPYTMGQLTVFVSPPTGDMGWHMSISHPKRYPTWDEVAYARYELIPNEARMVMALPPKEEYISIHNFCFQLHEEV